MNWIIERYICNEKCEFYVLYLKTNNKIIPVGDFKDKIHINIDILEDRNTIYKDVIIKE